MRDDFIPLIFAGDINVYSVARAFHEEYGIISNAYGKYPIWPCAGSKIINYTADPDADVQEVFLEFATNFANRNKDKKVIMIGCGDNYVRLLSQNLNNLPGNVIAPYIDIDLMDRLIDKEAFYLLCEKSGLDYPATFVYTKSMGSDFTLPFNGPYIIKPSNGIEYWRHPFPTQKKVYKAHDRNELSAIINDIYNAGYGDSLIIQDFIPGDDSYMRVLTNYSDKNGKVRMMCLGHVLLEEHTPHGIGNHAVIITEHDGDLENRIKSFLESIKYVGYSNFDIKFDRRDGKYKVFEINTRQGRSNYYVTNAGENVARYIVDDHIDGLAEDCRIVTKESLWLVIPKKVAFDYISNEEYKLLMKKLIRSGNYVNPLEYSEDGGLMRKLRFLKSQAGHFYKYRKYLGKGRGE